MPTPADTPAYGFPRQQARTRRFTLGAPRNFTVSPDGGRVVFLRSPGGADATTSLWVHRSDSGTETEVANAAAILGAADEQLPAEERARRERSRELAGGIVSYSCDEEVSQAVFCLGGRLFCADLDHPDPIAPVELPAPPGVVGPRPDPTGRLVAFLSGPRLCVVPASGAGRPTVLAEEEGEVTWGAAEFVAAEEMRRSRGFWWAPDGSSLLAARVDNAMVTTWWTADPSWPASVPQAHRYPVAGTADAAVSLWLIAVDRDVAAGAAGPGAVGPVATPSAARPRMQIRWDAQRYPYLVAVHWSRKGPPLLLVEQRDHKAYAILAVELSDGATSLVGGASDEAWVDWPAGVPAWSDGGQLVWGVPDAGTWRLKVGNELVTPPGLQVREVTAVGRSVVFTASTEPEAVEAWSWSADAGLQQLTDLGGVSAAFGAGPARVVVSRGMGWQGLRAQVEREGREPQPIADHSETPAVDPIVRFLRVGRSQLSVGVVLPTGHTGARLPVIMAPYGGPGHQNVLRAKSMWLEAQWVADQGFAVVVADGRGTPGRGPDFERAVYRDLARPPLEDQVQALQAAAEQVPELDLRRVGIKGWSFGGYLAALAVLARPDIFHAAIAGAPVTDWHFYDTYYTERFLGHPETEPEAYQRSSLLDLAPRLERPLLIIHGLADDNVFAVHTLQLSSALLVAGRNHSVLPLPGVTHVASKDDVTESLLLKSIEFFRGALAQPARL